MQSTMDGVAAVNTSLSVLLSRKPVYVSWMLIACVSAAVLWHHHSYYDLMVYNAAHFAPEVLPSNFFIATVSCIFDSKKNLCKLDGTREKNRQARE